MIHAMIFDENYQHYTSFDATPWFEQASPRDIAILIINDWEEDKPDGIAGYIARDNKYIDEILQYAHVEAKCGSSCCVNSGAAMEWVVRNRPQFLLCFGTAVTTIS